MSSIIFPVFFGDEFAGAKVGKDSMESYTWRFT
jgi:hypothetical protein